MNIFFLIVNAIFFPCFHLLIVHKLMKAFFTQNRNSLLIYVVWIMYYILQVSSEINIIQSPLIFLILNVVFILAINSISYSGSLKKRCVFSILICTVWMLIENIIGIVLDLFRFHGISLQMAGTTISMMCMFIFAVIISHYVKRKKKHDISIKYVLTVLLIPIVSIYLMHNIFLIASYHKEYDFFSIITGLLLLLINYDIYEVYDWMTQHAEIQEKNLLYKQQLDLCEQQAAEREIRNQELQRLRHNIKNYLACLLGIVQEKNIEAAEKYIRDFLKKEMDFQKNDVSRSGNIIVDSLLNYKCALARKYGIDVSATVFIPSILPFQSGHLTIILGNLLENALEACQEIIDRRPYIELNISYEKEVFNVVIRNPYEGERCLDRDGYFLTTKKNPTNHGLGLSSVEQAIEPYQGQMIIKYNDGIFQITVIMYGEGMEK